jgi:hypothetical protein
MYFTERIFKKRTLALQIFLKDSHITFDENSGNVESLIMGHKHTERMIDGRCLYVLIQQPGDQ